MSIHEYIRQYGTRSTSIVLRELGEKCYDITLDNDAQVLYCMARDLQSALEDYASQDFEPPTVGGRVI